MSISFPGAVEHMRWILATEDNCHPGDGSTVSSAR
jgi:hypothetical protein